MAGHGVGRRQHGKPSHPPFSLLPSSPGKGFKAPRAWVQVPGGTSSVPSKAGPAGPPRPGLCRLNPVEGFPTHKCVHKCCIHMSNMKLHPTKMNGMEEELGEASGFKKNSSLSFSVGASGNPRVNSDHKPGHSELWGPIQPGGFYAQETTSPPALE